MATEFNTRVGNGEYRLQFETDNREYYLLMQETARHCVDGKPVTNAGRIKARIEQIIDEYNFPQLERSEIMYTIADVLTDRLLPKKDGDGNG